jgi:hypothetical protein
MTPSASFALGFSAVAAAGVISLGTHFKPIRSSPASSRSALMGNVNTANLKAEEIEEFQLMSNCMHCES